MTNQNMTYRCVFDRVGRKLNVKDLVTDATDPADLSARVRQHVVPYLASRLVQVTLLANDDDQPVSGSIFAGERLVSGFTIHPEGSVE